MAKLHITAKEHISNMNYVTDHFSGVLYSIPNYTCEEAWYELVHLEPKYMIAVLGLLPEEQETEIVDFIKQWIKADPVKTIAPKSKAQYRAIIREIERLKKSNILHNPKLQDS